MKKQILTLAFVAFTAFGITCKAQEKPELYRNWVIEYNKKQPKIKTVRFYNDEQRLIYSETYNGRLNISRKKIQRKLNDVLDALVNGLDTARNNNILVSVLNKHTNLQLFTASN